MPYDNTLSPIEAGKIALNSYFALKDWINTKPVAGVETRANIENRVLGAANVGSYAIALWAMTHAPVAAVAALRETSILFAAAIAALVLREKISPQRLAAIALVACGALAMRLA